MMGPRQEAQPGSPVRTKNRLLMGHPRIRLGKGCRAIFTPWPASKQHEFWKENYSRLRDRGKSIDEKGKTI